MEAVRSAAVDAGRLLVLPRGVALSVADEAGRLLYEGSNAEWTGRRCSTGG